MTFRLWRCFFSCNISSLPHQYVFVSHTNMFLCLSTSPHAFEDALITGCGKVFMYVCCRLSQWHNLKDGRDLPNCQISRSCGWPILCFLDGQYFAVTFRIRSHLPYIFFIYFFICLFSLRRFSISPVTNTRSFVKF